MFVVPVIDLMDNVVVHARRGDRASYQPVRSKLTPSSAPMAIVDALLRLAPFRHLYIADLDAIQKRGDHRQTVLQLAQAFPQLEVWIDAGIGSVSDAKSWSALPVRAIVGSESLPELATWREIRRVAPRAILSLDTRAEHRMGPKPLFESADNWPEDVIVMTLDRVGSGLGPAMENLAWAKQLAPHANLIAAGGVRNANDLAVLETSNVYAALVATALHDGILEGKSLRRFLPD